MTPKTRKRRAAAKLARYRFNRRYRLALALLLPPGTFWHPDQFRRMRAYAKRIARRGDHVTTLGIFLTLAGGPAR